ncbi:MAG: helix-turn-helix domain-containing protein [Planctomycetota bacterium]
MTTDPPLRRPKQARSQRTLEQILDAAEQLLEGRTFESISVAELVREAGTSVGAFYTRFRDKDALLPALYERYDRWVAGRAARTRAARPWASLDFDATAAWVAGEIITLFRHRRYLLRAMTLFARLRPEKVDDATRLGRQQQLSFLREALLAHRATITHPDPERAADHTVFMAAAVCREAVLFRDAPHAKTHGMTFAELHQELTRFITHYLTGARPSRRPRRSPRPEPS